jgi:transcriptional regulator with XRE-family HTH domain
MPKKHEETSEPMTIKKFLLLAQQEFEREVEHRVTQEEFATYLGVNRVLLSYWMNGRNKPSPENLEQLSLKLGLGVYDAAGEQRPNVYYRYASHNWDNIPEKEQIRISQIISKYTSEPLPGDDDEATDTGTTEN